MIAPVETILMFTPSAAGGHARYTQELLTALCVTAHGRCRVELVSSRDLEPQFRQGPYTVHAILPELADRSTIPTRAGWIANRISHYPKREWMFLRWLAKQPHITGVHFQEWTPWLAAPMFRRIKAMGKRVFYTVHNLVPHKYPRLVPKSVMNEWIRSACHECNGLFVLTENLASELSEFLGDDHPPITVAPHGVWSMPAEVKLPTAAERLASRRLLCFGQLRRNKGIDLLLRAVQHLPGYRLTIAGDPIDPEYFHGEIVPLVNRLREMGREIDLTARFVSDAELAELFTTHGAIVLPYTSGFKSQSGVAFMAMAYGIPMVASEAGGLRELLGQFNIGTTFEKPTAQALAHAVRALHEGASPTEIDRQFTLARRRYSWREAARATLHGYALAGEKGFEADDRPVATTSAR